MSSSERIFVSSASRMPTRSSASIRPITAPSSVSRTGAGLVFVAPVARWTSTAFGLGHARQHLELAEPVLERLPLRACRRLASDRCRSAVAARCTCSPAISERQRRYSVDTAFTISRERASSLVVVEKATTLSSSPLTDVAASSLSAVPSWPRSGGDALVQHGGVGQRDRRVLHLVRVEEHRLRPGQERRHLARRQQHAGVGLVLSPRSCVNRFIASAPRTTSATISGSERRSAARIACGAAVHGRSRPCLEGLRTAD